MSLCHQQPQVENLCYQEPETQSHWTAALGFQLISAAIVGGFGVLMGGVLLLIGILNKVKIMIVGGALLVGAVAAAAIVYALIATGVVAPSTSTPVPPEFADATGIQQGFAFNYCFSYPAGGGDAVEVYGVRRVDDFLDEHFMPRPWRQVQRLMAAPDVPADWAPSITSTTKCYYRLYVADDGSVQENWLAYDPDERTIRLLTRPMPPLAEPAPPPDPIPAP